MAGPAAWEKRRGSRQTPPSPYSRHVTWGSLRAARLSVRYRKPSDINLTEGSGRAAVQQQKFDPSRPGNARKLEVVGELTKLADKAGLKLRARRSLSYGRTRPPPR
ncbi:hypothetical protein [Streptomyces sp. ISL-1]|uniref:hypothetical protein n=1 Tax=Streptomyces sp. ISL-1 TaxID=2817657 RepID=UPI0020351E01|nr:hypothetical protein [Streptomyces sp. ISL-1]